MSATASSKLALHILTSNEIVARPDFIQRSLSVIEALNSNCYFHLRVNTLSGAEHLMLANKLRSATDKVGAHLIVNGRVDVALSANAYGIQLGRGSLPTVVVREVWGAKLKIGVSVHTEGEVRALRTLLSSSHSADSWLLAGHVFETQSHIGAPPLGLEGLARIVSAAKADLSPGLRLEPTPVIAVGGINPTNLASVIATGASGVAVISDVWASNDPKGAATRYLSLL